MIVGERQRREDEKKRLQDVITERRKDIAEIEADKTDYKAEVDERLERERAGRRKFQDRIAQLMPQLKLIRIRGQVVFLRKMVSKKQLNC